MTTKIDTLDLIDRLDALKYNADMDYRIFTHSSSELREALECFDLGEGTRKHLLYWLEMVEYSVEHLDDMNKRYIEETEGLLGLLEMVNNEQTN